MLFLNALSFPRWNNADLIRVRENNIIYFVSKFINSLDIFLIESRSGNVLNYLLIHDILLTWQASLPPFLYPAHIIPVVTFSSRYCNQWLHIDCSTTGTSTSLISGSYSESEMCKKPDSFHKSKHALTYGFSQTLSNLKGYWSGWVVNSDSQIIVESFAKIWLTILSKINNFRLMFNVVGA